MPTNIQTSERRVLSIQEAARACGLSRATMYRLIADGKLTTLKMAPVALFLSARSMPS